MSGCASSCGHPPWARGRYLRGESEWKSGTPTPHPEGETCEPRGVATASGEEARKDEEETPAPAEPDATREQPPERARLAAVHREQEYGRQLDGQVGLLDAPGPHLAAPVGDAHRPGATALAVEHELGREGEPSRLGRTEVLRHPAHHRVHALRPDAPQGDQPHARRGAAAAIGRCAPLPGRDAVTLARARRVDHELLV